MHLDRLALTDFRCYATAELRMEPGVTAFTGANGQGKTNLIEAVGYVATLASHRVATDAPLVRSGAERAIVRAGISAADRSTLVEIEINPARPNRARLNRAPVLRPRQVLGALRAVLFAPEDLALVKGDPGERRRYLDELLIQSAPRYAGVKADYDRVVKQRTALLKSARARPAASQAMLGALEAWDEQLARTGAGLMAGRLELVAALRPLMVKAYAAVSGEECAVEAAYRPALPDKAEPPADAAVLAGRLREALAVARRAELERGVCLAGPHRDELELKVGGLPARGYASHGESWSLALALRLAGYELLRAAGEEPVLLLDDVFAELDGQRRDRLADVAAHAEQVLVTTAVPGDLPAVLASARFDVAGGLITRAG
ncbi:MAG TPA: DNA replication/repair protein RecF [Streptosporangiaceae bacterium]|nr:DNA replication/repair protein RecF [Streptosporangiaceae bacterium]